MSKEKIFKIKPFLSLTIAILFLIIFILNILTIYDSYKTFRYIKYSKKSYSMMCSVHKLIYCIINEKNQILTLPKSNHEKLYNKTNSCVNKIIQKTSQNNQSKDISKQISVLLTELEELRNVSFNKSTDEQYILYCDFIDNRTKLFKYLVDMPTTRGVGARIWATYTLIHLEYSIEQLSVWLNHCEDNQDYHETCYLLANKVKNNMKTALNAPTFSISENSVNNLEMLKKHTSYELLNNLPSITMEELVTDRHLFHDLYKKTSDIINFETSLNNKYIEKQLMIQLIVLTILIGTFILLSLLLLYLVQFFKRNLFKPLEMLSLSVQNSSFDLIELNSIKSFEFQKFASILIDYHLQNEEFLRNKEDLKAISEHTYNWEFWIDEFDNLRYVSPSCEKVIGYTSQDFLNQKVLIKDIIHFEDKEKFQLHHCNTETCENSIDLRFIHKNGSIKWFSHVCRKIYNNGRYIGIRGVNIDIDDRKSLENKLTQSTQIYKSLISASPDAICVTDVSGNIEFASRTMLELFKIENFNSIKDKKFKSLISSEYQEMFFNNHNKLLESKKAVIAKYEIIFNETEHNNKRDDLTNKIIVINSAPTLDENNNIMKIISVIRDETYMYNLINNLELLKRKAELANLSKKKFISHISHELRVPMNGIMGMLELLKLTELNNLQNEYVQLLKDSSINMMTVINDLLDLSKIESGNFQITISEINLHDLVQRTVKLNNQILQNKFSQGFINKIHNTSLELHIDNNMPKIFLGDSYRLTQVLNILISNAIKFTDKGIIKIYINLLQTIENKADIEIKISDTGLNLSQKDTDLLLRENNSAMDNLPELYINLDIGLQITKNILNLMNGKLKIVKTDNFKSDLIIRFNLDLVAQKFDSNIVKNKVKSLIFSSSIQYQDFFNNHFSGFGISVDICSNLTDFINTLIKQNNSDEAYNLVITDTISNSINYCKIIDFIKHEIYLNGSGKTKFILIANSEMNSSEKESILSTFDFILVKPIDVKKLDLFIQSFQDYLNNLNSDNYSFDTKEIKHPSISEGINLLLVEDSFVNRTLVLEMLKNLKWNIFTAENGQIAIDMYKQKHFDLVLMDIQMPIMDGYTATKHIKEIQKQKNMFVPIIALTAHAMKGDKEKCLNAGMDDYLSKPVDYNTLKTMCDKWLLKTSAQTETESIKNEILNSDYLNIADLAESIRIDVETYKSLLIILYDETLNSESIIRNQLSILNSENINQNNSVLIKNTLHKLKGQFLNLNIPYLTDILVELDKSFKDLNFDKLDKQLRIFDDELNNFYNWLRNLNIIK